MQNRVAEGRGWGRLMQALQSSLQYFVTLHFLSKVLVIIGVHHINPLIPTYVLSNHTQRHLCRSDMVDYWPFCFAQPNLLHVFFWLSDTDHMLEYKEKTVCEMGCSHFLQSWDDLKGNSLGRMVNQFFMGIGIFYLFHCFLFFISLYV